MKVESIRDLQRLVRNGFDRWAELGDIRVTQEGPLLLFNYTVDAVVVNRWNFVERVSRGLILDRFTGAVVARPFDKFFGWGEGGRTTDAPLVRVCEKLDGSLGILYRRLGQVYVATRGSFGSTQAQWATEWLRTHCDVTQIDDRLTLLFEIIYPANRVVVDYGGYEGLVLLAIRNRHTGAYLPWDEVRRWADRLGLDTPSVYSFGSVDEVVASLPSLSRNEEGFVAEFADGQRFKMKGHAYLLVHRALARLSFRNTLQAVAQGQAAEIRQQIPDEFLGPFNAWVAEIEAKVADITQAVEEGWARAPRHDRKAFAQWVQAEMPARYAPYCFMRFDGRDYLPLIYKREFRDRLAADTAAHNGEANG